MNKILVWIHKDDIISGKRPENWYNICPQGTNWSDYYQVSITKNAFTRLLDENEEVNEENLFKDEEALIPGPGCGEKTSELDRHDDWLVEQYNRNRAPEDHINDIDELDQNNQAFGD
jgi:hypothetical protein